MFKGKRLGGSRKSSGGSTLRFPVLLRPPAENRADSQHIRDPPVWTHFCLLPISLSAEENQESSKGMEPIITWKDFQRAMPWEIVILVGGGYALASGSKVSHQFCSVGLSVPQVPIPTEVSGAGREVSEVQEKG